MNEQRFFAARLRELRAAAGLTQRELAERAGMHPQSLVKLENEDREPTWATVLVLAAALGVKVQAFTVEPKETAPAPRGRPRKVAEAAPAARKRGKK